MKTSIILFVTAVIFLALGIIAHAGKPVDENGMPFGNGFPSGYNYNLNILGKQGHFTCQPPEYVYGTQAYGDVRFIPYNQGNDPITILMESVGNGTAALSSDGITLNRTSIRI